MSKLKAGQINVEIEKEETLWFDRKRVTIFALPWSFTKYTLTETKLLVEEGFFTKREEEVKLYRVADISYSQTFWERIGKTGSLVITSNDATMPRLVLKHIKNAKTIKEVISKTIDAARKNNGVRTSEMVGGMPDLDGSNNDSEGVCVDPNCTEHND